VVDLAIAVMGGIDLDPCADPLKRIPASTHFTKADDGLEQAWAGRVFLNPPYSGATKWFKHLTIYKEAGTVTEAVILVPITTLGNKGARLLMKRTATCLTIFDRSINFLDADYSELASATPIPLCLIYCGKNTDTFLSLTQPYGYGLLIHITHPQHRQKQCLHCGSVFTTKRSTAKFCGTTCRVESHRKRFIARQALNASSSSHKRQKKNILNEFIASGEETAPIQQPKSK
jgi:hypothetical protein